MSAAPAASPHRFLRSETIDKLCHSPLHGEPPSHWFVILPLLHKPLQVPDQKTSPTTGLSTNPVKHLGRLHGVQLESKERKGCGHPTLEDSLQSKDQHLSPFSQVLIAFSQSTFAFKMKGWWGCSMNAPFPFV